MGTMPTTEEMSTIERLAERLFKAKAFPDTVKSMDTAFAILLKGWELGMPAMAAAAGIAIVSGKVSLGADATAGACLRHRDICLYFSLVESTHEVARYETHRAGAPKPVALTYTIAQAKTAGLTGSPTWQKHTPAMLRARCAAALARATYPDLVAGCYDPDEAREIVGDVRPVETPAADPRDLSALGVEVRTERGRDHVRDALSAVGGDNPTLGEHNVAVAEAIAAERQVDDLPAWQRALEALAESTPVLAPYCNAVERAALPGDCVAVWMRHRADLAAMPAPDREAAWKALALRCETVGHMKNARVWLKKSIAETDAARAVAPVSSETGAA